MYKTRTHTAAPLEGAAADGLALLGGAAARILQSLESVMVRAVLFFRWKRNVVAVAERIRAFEATEDDSTWQLLHACARIEEPGIKAKLFLQAMEEMHHAEIFRKLYEESSGRKLSKASVQRKPIFQDGQPGKLFLYCAIGEASAAKRFRQIADALPAGVFRDSLRKILLEEEGHIELAQGLSDLTGMPAPAVRAEVRKIRWTRAYEHWLRVGRGVTGALARLLLLAAYYGLGWWIRVGAPKAAARRAWAALPRGEAQ